MTTDERKLLQEISLKLSILIFLELQRDGGGKVQDHVLNLARFGLSTSDIAEILNTTPGTVAVAKSRLKRRKNRL
jgi:hypothetical protein